MTRMQERLRTLRDTLCEPENNRNPRYHIGTTSVSHKPCPQAAGITQHKRDNGQFASFGFRSSDESPKRVRSPTVPGRRFPGHQGVPRE